MKLGVFLLVCCIFVAAANGSKANLKGVSSKQRHFSINRPQKQIGGNRRSGSRPGEHFLTAISDRYRELVAKKNSDLFTAPTRIEKADTTLSGKTGNKQRQLAKKKGVRGPQQNEKRGMTQQQRRGPEHDDKGQHMAYHREKEERPRRSVEEDNNRHKRGLFPSLSQKQSARRRRPQSKKMTKISKMPFQQKLEQRNACLKNPNADYRCSQYLTHLKKQQSQLQQQQDPKSRRQRAGKRQMNRRLGNRQMNRRPSSNGPSIRERGFGNRRPGNRGGGQGQSSPQRGQQKSPVARPLTRPNQQKTSGFYMGYRGTQQVNHQGKEARPKREASESHDKVKRQVNAFGALSDPNDRPAMPCPETPVNQPALCPEEWQRRFGSKRKVPLKDRQMQALPDCNDVPVNMPGLRCRRTDEAKPVRMGIRRKNQNRGRGDSVVERRRMSYP